MTLNLTLNVIFNNNIDLPALTLSYKNWTELDDDITVYSRVAIYIFIKRLDPILGSDWSIGVFYSW